MDDLSKVQTNEIETSSLKSVENALKSSSESLGKHSLSNGSVVKGDTDGAFVDNSHQTMMQESISSDHDDGKANGEESSKIDKKEKNEQFVVEDNTKIILSGTEENVAAQKSDSEISSTLSATSEESEDEEIEIMQSKSKQTDESKSHGSHSSSCDAADKNDDANNTGGELILKLQEAWSKFEELKEKSNEQGHRLAAAEEKNKDLFDKHENLKLINEELQEDLQSSLSALEERNSTIENLRSELVNMKSSRESLENELKAAREEIDKLHSAQEDHKMSMKEQVEAFKQLQTKSDEQEEEIGKLKDQLEMAKKELDMNATDKTEVELKLQEELVNAKNTIRKMNQANSKLEAKLSNSQTIIETADVERRKLKEEVRSLKDKIKWLEKRRASEKEGSPTTPRSEGGSRPAEQVDRRVSHEAQRKAQERVRELEQKVIQVNDEKQKLKHDYDEAVKALEAVDKVYSVRELALQQYKTELDEANELVKQQSSEIHLLKLEVDQLKVDLKRAEENKEENQAAQDDLQEQLTKAKEANRIYKEEIDDVRKELSDQVHELQLAQAKGRERGKRNQILELEVRETKETLLISKSIIEEKQKNTESLKEDLRNEKKTCKTLQQDLEELDYLKKKLLLIEDEKARIVEKMKRTEIDLKETEEALKKSCLKFKEMEKEKETLIKSNQKLRSKCEDQVYQIQTLLEVVENKESDIEQQLIALIHTRSQVDELNLQLQEMWASYSADRALWKNKGGRSIWRRHRSASAPSKRLQQASPPLYQSLPETKTHSLAHRRLVNKLGLPIVNPDFINTMHKDIKPESTKKSTQNNEVQDASDGPPNNLKTSDKTSQTPKDNPCSLSPRPPADGVDKRKPKRPLSSYGVRTYPPMNGEHYRTVSGMNGVLSEDFWLHTDGLSITSGDTDEEVVKYLVNKGDRVMIQSKVAGDDNLNISGVVKYVGKVGKKTSSPVYVGLKLDQPLGDNNGTVGGKHLFSCPPRHGKLIKMSDVNAVMHPRTKNFDRVKAMTLKG